MWLCIFNFWNVLIYAFVFGNVQKSVELCRKDKMMYAKIHRNMPQIGGEIFGMVNVALWNFGRRRERWPHLSPFLIPFQIPPFSSLIYICRNFQFLPRIRLRVAENCPSTTIKSLKGCRSFWFSSNSSWISNKMFIKILIRFREKLPSNKQKIAPFSDTIWKVIREQTGK